MIIKELFGKLDNGSDVYSYTLINEMGASVKIISLGATLVSISVPDKSGNMADVICGYDDVKSYLNNGGYQGAIIGRFGNRIKNSSFKIDGIEYKLYSNEGNNHLHGGKEGFDKKLWDAKYWEVGCTMFLEMSYLSKDMEEGYPGNLLVKVLYTFDQSNALSINYKAVTDKKTVLNLTNHAYFNLGGYNSSIITKNHSLWIDSDKISEIDEKLIPTGREVSVENTPFDFRTEKSIGKEIDVDNGLLGYGKGYDHNFILNNNGEIKHVVTLCDNESGRKMKLFTNQPCIQVYTANCINEEESSAGSGMWSTRCSARPRS